jgi:hypothetical protein
MIHDSLRGGAVTGTTTLRFGGSLLHLEPVLPSQESTHTRDLDLDAIRLV